MVVSQTAFAADAVIVDLDSRVEVRTGDSKTSISVCHKLECSFVGSEKGYDSQALAKISAKTTDPLLSVLLKAGSAGTDTLTYALLKSPVVVQGKTRRSVFGYGGSLYLGVFSSVQNSRSSDFSTQVPRDMIANMRFFESETKPDEAATKLRALLK